MLDGIWAHAVAGVIAGLGVAMPLGAIAALLLREGVVNGFRVAAASAAGVATVDVVYCVVATTAGALLSQRVEEHRGLFLVVSGVVVVGIGLRNVRQGMQARRPPTSPNATRASAVAAYARFVGLTAVNPLTLVYFVALGGVVTTPGGSWVAPAVFTAAVGLASLAWQLGLAAVGTIVGGSLGGRAVRVIDITASVLVIALGIGVIATGAAASPWAP